MVRRAEAKTQTAPFGAPGFLAAVGLGAAVATITDPDSRFAVLFLGAVGILLTLALSWSQKERETSVFLGRLMLLAVAVRFLILAAVHQTVGPYVFAPDQVTYERFGLALVQFWEGQGVMPWRLRGTLQVGYPFLNGALFFVFGPARAAPSAVNIFLSTWTAVPLYYLTLALVRGNQGVARWTAILASFFPSLMLWSVLNIREAPAILLVVLAVFFATQLKARPSTGALFGFIVTLGALAFIREYLTVLVGFGTVGGLAVGRSRSPARALVIAAVGFMALTFVVQTLGLAGTLVSEPSLDQVEFLRQAMTADAGSAYGQGFDVSTPGGAILFLPLGLTYFLLAPFPWAVESFLQTVTLPETFLWYVLFIFALRGGLLAFRHDPGAYTVPILVLVLVTFSYALVEGNVGTAYRHRAQILPLVFVFCAVGLRDVYVRWSERRQAVAEARRTAVTPGMRQPFVRPGSPLKKGLGGKSGTHPNSLQ